MINKVLITGATGVLGRHLLKLCLFQKNIEIILLIRGQNYQEKYKTVLKDIIKNKAVLSNVRIVSGDTSKPSFGLKKEDYKSLTQSVNEIFHCAANVSYYHGLGKEESDNVVTTRNILNFSKESPCLKQLNYISTIFIAGNIEGEFKESDFNLKQSFNGAYEKSKFDSEILVREAFNKRFNISIYRPSALVGEYSSGAVASFQMFYQFFRSLSLNLFRILPINYNGIFNLIPCDIAAEAIFLLSKKNYTNTTFHIINPKNFLIFDLVKLIIKYLNCKEPKFINISNFSLQDLSLYEKKLMGVYLPFLNFRTIFKGERTFKELRKLGFVFPRFDNQFILRQLDYAVSKGFIIKNNV